MIQNKYLRYGIGVVLGGMAGLSFCISILPVALEIAGAGTQSYLGVLLSKYAGYSALVWVAGGWATARAGFLKAGMVIMAIVGISTGILLVAMGLVPKFGFLVAGGLGGLVYGLVGGMLLGRVLSRSQS